MKKLCIFASKILIFQRKCTSWEILSKKVYKFHIFEYILNDRHSVSSQSILGRKHYYLRHTEEQTEAWRVDVICRLMMTEP